MGLKDKIKIECLNMKLELTLEDTKHAHVSLGVIKIQLQDVAALLHDILIPVSELKASRRVYNCLDDTSIKYIHQLASYKRHQLLSLKWFGIKACNECEFLLKRFGLELGMGISDIFENLIEYKFNNQTKDKK